MTQNIYKKEEGFLYIYLVQFVVCRPETKSTYIVQYLFRSHQAEIRSDTAKWNAIYHFSFSIK